VKIKKFIHTCNQINRKPCVLINDKKNHQLQLKTKQEKLKDICRSRYLILQEIYPIVFAKFAN